MNAKDMTNAGDATEASPAVEFYHANNYFAETSVGHLMKKIVAYSSHAIEREMEPYGLTNAQWVPLVKLFVGDADTAAGLARECGLDAGAMTRLLDRVEAKGLCSRQRSSHDRRVVNLQLTDEGREAALKIPVVLARMQNACLAGFTHEEWEALKGYLRRILDNAQALAAAGESNEKQQDPQD
ncbi:MAG: MarR family winged helix-turn-helix transcriptional regulator [Burkholderiales bacterium]|nr:MarR family winged helix-turn-helix transcriptional regulator [Burkholderiales bacterium]